MAAQKSIIGKVAYQDIEMGFWGITDTNGNDWRPVQMPEQLKVNGATVKCTIREVEEEVSIFMWGTPVEIIAFETPYPGR